MAWTALAVCGASVCLAAESEVRETLFGFHGGTQSLKWQDIVPNSEMVLRNGSIQAAGTDYVLNPQYGLLELTPPLGPDESAEISYLVRAGVSKEIAKLALTPIEASFFSVGPASLGLVAQMRRDGTGYAGVRASFAATSELNVVGQYLIGAGQSDTDMLRLAANGKLIGGVVKAGYDRTAAGFTDANALGARPDAATLFADWRSPFAFVSFRQEDPNTGETAVKAGGGLNLKLLPGMTFAASRSYSALGDDSRTKDKVEMAYTPSRLASFGVDWNGGPGLDGVARLRMSLDDPVANIRASHTISESGAAPVTDVSTSIRVTPCVRVETSARAETGHSASDTKMWFEPLPGIGFAATYQNAVNATYEEGAGVEMRLAPTRFLELGGVGRRRVKPDHTEVETLSMEAKFAPLPGLALTGLYADRPEDQLGFPQEVTRRKLGANLSCGCIWLGGSFSQDRQLTDLNGKQSYILEGGVKFSRATALRFSYGEDSLFSSALSSTRLYTVGFTHSSGLVNLSLEGRMSQPYENGQALLDRRTIEGRASLGISF